VRHVITDEERRTGEINLGEYVFAALAITEQKIVLEQQLTQEEKDNLEDESEEDRIFRNLFEHQNEINPYSRLKWTENWGIKPNVFGLEYRLDNGSEKSVSILDSAGIGDIDTGSYLDGSSKVLLIDLDKHISTVHGEDDPEENVIYLTYVAIDKHYIRQRINASWQFFDGGLQDNVSLPLSIKVVHYRFYEWKLEDGTEIAGWRAVESYFAKPNVTAAIAEAVPVLGDFVAGPKVGLNTITYMPAKLDKEDLQEYINSGRTTFRGLLAPKYDFQYDNEAPGGLQYHLNTSNVGGEEVDAYQKSDWWSRKKHRTFSQSFNPITEHVFFNIHPKALNKRDIDKWGIERSMALEIEKDIKQGKDTFFAFMDDKEVDQPTIRGIEEYLNSSNCKFEPIQPLQRYGLNNLTAIADGIGSFQGSPRSDLFSYHSFDSNIISERFEKNTKVLVEKFFAIGTGIHSNLITIEGSLAGPPLALSSLADPSKEFIMLAHVNNIDRLIYNRFLTGNITTSLLDLTYNPDSSFPDYDVLVPNNFTPQYGYAGVLGENPGITPGVMVANSELTENDYKTYDKTDEGFDFKIENGKLIITPKLKTVSVL